MRFFGRNRKQPIDFDGIKPPWQHERPAIYAHIKEHLDNGKLSQDGIKLPDEDIYFKDSKIRWVAGGIDGAMGHHTSSDQGEKRAKLLFKALQNFLKHRNNETLSEFYSLLIEENVLAIVDPFIQQTHAAGLLQEPSLYALSKWILKNAPDREAIKATIAILGVCGTDDDRELFVDISKHEEFTLYGAVALIHSAEDPEAMLFDIAKAVDGWGRIQLIERLESTTNPDIQNWMLREGYQNSVMYEYTARICATTGNLLSALSCDQPDDEILIAAGQILASMAHPGDALEEYTDGPQATLMLLRHLEHRDITISQLVTLHQLKEAVLGIDCEDPDLTEWSDVRESVLRICEQIRSRAHWRDEVQRDLRSTDRVIFWNATRAAPLVGVDAWERYYERIESGESDSDWYHLMQTQDEDRVKRALHLAEKVLPLSELCCGVGDETGFGQKFALYNAISYVVSALRHYPGLGYDLVHVALRSPVVSNRNSALRTLQWWGKDTWEPDAENKLRQLLSEEPNERVRQFIEEILAGKEPEHE